MQNLDNLTSAQGNSLGEVLGCIDHPQDDLFIEIHGWQVRFMDGDGVAAALLSFFERWHNLKLEKESSTDLYQWHTEAELEQGILIASRGTIAKSLERLVKRGFVTIHRNPNPKYKFDKTRFFLFHPHAVNEAIAWLPEQKPLRGVKGFVYVIKAVSTHKIGVTSSPKERLKQISRKMNAQAEYVLLKESDDIYGLESKLHEIFREKRIEGEWFNLEPSDIEAIRVYCDRFAGVVEQW
jgi:hypothetical protein